MALPITYSLVKSGLVDGKKFPQWALPFLITLDSVATITCLVVAILGLTSVIGLSPASSYALIGVSAAIVVSWICYKTHQHCTSINKPLTEFVVTELSD